MSNCLKQCIRVLSKSNLMSQKSSASSSTLFGHCLSTNLAGNVPAVSVLHNQHQFFSTTSCRLKKGMGPNKQAMLQIKDQRLRIRDIPVEVAKLYMESEAYKQAYGDFKVWELHKRNFAKGKVHVDTRKKCTKHHKIQTSNPCPLCRDMYLVLHPENVNLLNQFINEHSGDIFTTKMTGVCQMKQKELMIAVEKSRDLGLLTIDHKFVEYDYSKYNR